MEFFSDKKRMGKRQRLLVTASMLLLLSFPPNPFFTSSNPTTRLPLSLFDYRNPPKATAADHAKILFVVFLKENILGASFT
jgi:hypothetical protein